MKNVFIIIFLILILAESCKKPYAPTIIATNNNYLVVEGFVNSGSDSTLFRLSRTIKLSDKSTPKPELNALITVESDQNNSYSLQEAGNGVYSSAPLNLPASAKYRVRIKTLDGKEYLSDYTEAKTTPDIDSVSYKVQDNGIQFYVTSHDPQNKTRYYRWDFDETWKYISLYRSFYKLGSDGYPTFRVAYNADDNIYECYKTDQSHQVLLGSSAKLGQDVISMQPIDFIDASSGKISFGYSVLLRQYALTAEGFAYWQNVKKNTEQLGSIFDAQPSTLQGNIHCTTDPKEPVIGYISTSSFTSKRIFIDHYNISLFTPSYLAPPSQDECVAGYIPIDPIDSYQNRLNNTFGRGDTVLINAVQPRGAPAIIGYTYAAKECVDCRAKTPFGTNKIPSYWPYQ